MSTDKTALGDRMKQYEGMESDRRLLPRLPVLVRIDGRAFSQFTRGMERPFDAKMSRLMIETTKRLVDDFGAVLGYTQSDEISLVLHDEDEVAKTDSAIPFDGRVLKLATTMATKATAVFMFLLKDVFPDRLTRLPTFDARIWNVPTREEAANVILWRERDATKNSIQMAARALYSHNECNLKNGSELQEMIFQKGINWNDYPAFFKRGTFIQRRKTSKPFTADEIEKLPPKHAARSNPDLVVERSQLLELDMPPFGKVRNRVQVIFDGAEPIVGEEEVPEDPLDVNLLIDENQKLRGLLNTAIDVYTGSAKDAADETWLDEGLKLLGKTL